MDNTPGNHDRDDDNDGPDRDENANPFKGTPFEQFFSGGLGGLDLGSLGAMFGTPGAGGSGAPTWGRCSLRSRR